MNFSERVVAEIRAEMGRQRRSVASLETLMGLPQTYLWRRLSGRVPLSLDDVEAIAAALEVPVTAFFGFPEHVAAGGGGVRQLHDHGRPCNWEVAA